MYRKQAILAVGAVQAEYRVAAWAVERCRQQAEADPSILNLPRIELNEIRRCGLTRAATYFIHLITVIAPAHLSGSL